MRSSLWWEKCRWGKFPFFPYPSSYKNSFFFSMPKNGIAWRWRSDPKGESWCYSQWLMSARGPFFRRTCPYHHSSLSLSRNTLILPPFRSEVNSISCLRTRVICVMGILRISYFHCTKVTTTKSKRSKLDEIKFQNLLIVGFLLAWCYTVGLIYC